MDHLADVAVARLRRLEELLHLLLGLLPALLALVAVEPRLGLGDGGGVYVVLLGRAYRLLHCHGLPPLKGAACLLQDLLDAAQVLPMLLMIVILVVRMSADLGA